MENFFFFISRDELNRKSINILISSIKVLSEYTMSGTGRLPSLNQSNGKPSLKFKPKFLARRSKEEREASIPKTAPEEVSRPFDKKKYSKRNNGPNQQKRLPRYLNNTRVITSGPLGAGNFSAGGSDPRTGFIKTEGSNFDLLQKGLKAANNGQDENDSDGDGITKINMGREYNVHEIGDDEEEELSEEEIDEDSLQSKMLANLFPVRAIRVKHEDMDIIKKELQESMSDVTTREHTPGFPKLENDGASLQSILEHRDTELQQKLDNLRLQNEFHSVDSAEAMEEVKMLNEDHKHIVKKLNKLNNMPNKFMVFQLPSDLPDFEVPEPPVEKKAEVDQENTQASGEAEKTEDEVKVAKEEGEKAPKNHDMEEEKPLMGRIGSIRIHKSGKLSVKIGNVVMDISRGSETSFLQDVVALDERDEERTVELLGNVDGKVVITPRF